MSLPEILIQVVLVINAVMGALLILFVLRTRR